MKRILVLVALAALTVPALASEIGVSAGDLYVNLATGQTSTTARAGTPVMVYDNMTPTTKAAYSSYDVTATWGDEITMVGTGVLRSFGFTLFNSGSSAGTLINPAVEIGFYQTDGTLIGGFSGTVTGTLNQGYFWNVNFSDLDDSFTLDLSPYTNIIVTQAITSFSGACSRAGMVCKGPIAIGSSPDTWYWDGTDATLFPSGAGWYNSSTVGNNDVGYSIGVTPEPASLLVLVVAGALIRRR